MNNGILLEIINGLIGILLLIVAWTVRMYKQDHDKLKQSHNDHKLDVTKNYALKTDLNAARLETNESLKRVYDKIESVDTNLDRKITALPKTIMDLMEQRK